MAELFNAADKEKIVDILISYKVKEIMINTSSSYERDEVLAITMDENFTDTLHLDSLDSVEIIMGIEERLGVDIPDEDAENMTKLRTICDHVKGRLESKGESIFKVMENKVTEELLHYLDKNLDTALTPDEKLIDDLSKLVDAICARVNV